MNDQELDLLLSEYRSNKPSDLQMQKWKRAIRQEISGGKSSNKRIWVQVIAASIVGFILGAMIFKAKEDPIQKFAKNDYESATIEYVYTKSN